METSLIKSAPANQHQDSAILTNRVEVETNCYSVAPVIVIFPRLSLATSLTEFFDWFIFLYGSCDYFIQERVP